MDFWNINADVALGVRDVLLLILMGLPILRGIWMRYQLNFLDGLQNMGLDDLQDWWKFHLLPYSGEEARQLSIIRHSLEGNRKSYHIRIGNILDKKIPLIMRDVRCMSCNDVYCKWFEHADYKFDLFIWEHFTFFLVSSSKPCDIICFLTIDFFLDCHGYEWQSLKEFVLSWDQG